MSKDSAKLRAHHHTVIIMKSWGLATAAIFQLFPKGGIYIALSTGLRHFVFYFRPAAQLFEFSTVHAHHV